MDKPDRQRFDGRSGASKGGASAQLVLGGRSVVARVRRRMPWLGTIGPVLTLADAAAVIIAGVVVTDAAPATLAVAAGVAVLVARAADLHRPRLVLSIAEDLPGLFVAAAAATAILVGAGSMWPALCVLVLACLVLAHTSVYAGTHVLRRGGRLGRPVVVVGTGTTARRLASTLLTRPELGLRPVGFVGTGPAGALDQARGLPLALLGPVAGLPRSMTETHVDAVVVALSCPAGDEETAAIDGLLATNADVYAVPAWFPPVRARARHPRELVDGITGRAPAPSGRVAPGAGVQAAGRGARRPGHAGRPAPRLRGAGASRPGRDGRRAGPPAADRRARSGGDGAVVPHPEGAVGGSPGHDVLGRHLGSDRAGREAAAPHPPRRTATAGVGAAAQDALRRRRAGRHPGRGQRPRRAPTSRR